MRALAIAALEPREFETPAAEPLRGSVLRAPDNRINVLFNRYASNATSFMTFYDGFHYFLLERGSESGFISFVETAGTWVGAADPVGPPGLWRDLLSAFEGAARAAGKTAVLLPVCTDVASLAREMGYRALQIGSEPWLKLGDQNNAAHFASVNQLQSRGATVETFDPDQISSEDKVELEEVAERWLDSRKCANLSFLNRVEPWKLSAHKRYYRLVLEGKVEGFLAAVPVPGRNAWYLVDLIRCPDSPAGTTELLVIEAMKQLRREGASEVTLGMSPLANVGAAESLSHPMIYRALGFAFEHLNTFYSFKSLYAYKEKFRPQAWEPCYLISLSPTFSVRSSLGLFRAMFPGGIVGTTIASIRRFLSHVSAARTFANLLSDRVVMRPMPRTMSDTVLRCPVTLLTLANAVAASLTGTVHFSALNLLLLALFGGSLEMVGGSLLTVTAYAVGLSLPIAIAALTSAPFIGAGGFTLALFSSMGAWLQFVRRPVALGALICALAITFGMGSSPLAAICGLGAAVLGYAVAKWFVK